MQTSNVAISSAKGDPGDADDLTSNGASQAVEQPSCYDLLRLSLGCRICVGLAATVHPHVICAQRVHIRHARGDARRARASSYV